MNTPCISLRPARAAAALDISPATLWNKLNRGEIAFYRDNGITAVVNDWVGEAPPREGRPPSIREYIAERLAATVAQPKRAVPEGRHVGRPRKHPVATE